MKMEGWGIGMIRRGGHGHDVCGGGGGCAGGGVPLGAMPALSWCGEVSLGVNISSSSPR